MRNLTNVEMNVVTGGAVDEARITADINNANCKPFFAYLDKDDNEFKQSIVSSKDVTVNINTMLAELNIDVKAIYGVGATRVYDAGCKQRETC